MPKIRPRDMVAIVAGGFESGTISFFRREFSVDIMREYAKLKDLATLPVDKLRDRFALSAALNASSGAAFKANLIYLKAKKECELYKIRFNARMRALNRRAVQRIEAWLAGTSGRKQITNDMVIEEICSDIADRKEYEEMVREREELLEIRDNLKCLAEMWADRKGVLQSQSKLLTSEREVILGHGTQHQVYR